MSHDQTDIIFGCGYLGHRVAKLWRDEGRNVVAVTRSHARAEQFRNEGLQPLIADVCRPETLTALPNADRVLFAVGFDRQSEFSQEEVFVRGISHVLDQLSTRCQRFLYISSTSVYGQNDGSWVDENSPCDPVQPGGRCCVAAERLIRQHFPAGDSIRHAVILRLAGIYGPGRLLSRIADLKAGTPLSGNPDAWLNLIEVTDAVQAVDAAAQVPQPGLLYLVADDQPVARRDYYNRLAELVGAASPRFDDSQPAKRGSGGLNKRCSNQRMKTELGVQLKFPTFAEGLVNALVD